MRLRRQALTRAPFHGLQHMNSLSDQGKARVYHLNDGYTWADTSGKPKAWSLQSELAFHSSQHGSPDVRVREEVLYSLRSTRVDFRHNAADLPSGPSTPSCAVAHAHLPPRPQLHAQCCPCSWHGCDLLPIQDFPQVGGGAGHKSCIRVTF